jgi:hypothetical protein
MTNAVLIIGYWIFKSGIGKIEEIGQMRIG